jgi:hypothetical protein
VQILTGFPQVRLHSGWIPERFADVGDQSFAFVHVEVDLYEPTRNSLELFWPRLTRGGVLSCDDYGLTHSQAPNRQSIHGVIKRPSFSSCRSVAAFW